MKTSLQTVCRAVDGRMQIIAGDDLILLSIYRWTIAGMFTALAICAIL